MLKIRTALVNPDSLLSCNMAIIYVAATKGEFLEQYWYWVALAVVVVHILAIGFIVLYRESKEKESDKEIL